MVFLSSHLDDAVLSCGGTIHCLNNLGVPIDVISIFAGSPISELSPFAKSLHAVWKLPFDAPMYRRAEDRKATSSLRARSVHLSFQSSIYRRNPATQEYLYTTRENIFSGNWNKEPTLLSSICGELQHQLATQNWELLFVPLGIGQHIDHILNS